MTPISQMPVGEVISSIRDITFVLGILYTGWKARAWVQPIITFFDNANAFMVDTRKDLQMLLNNHLTHIEADLRHMSGRHEHVDLIDSSEGDDAIR